MAKDDNQWQRWKYELDLAVAHRAHDIANEFQKWSNDAALNNANIALRTLVLINGGAAVALLAFVGSLATAVNEFEANVAVLAAPLQWFAFGVALAAFGIGLAYFTNYCTTGSSAASEHTYEHPFIKSTKASKRWRLAAITFQVLAVASAVTSLVLFVCGMFGVRAVILALPSA
jgi:hypothetical protein